jgi:Protein of unknown function (DUF1761)
MLNDLLSNLNWLHVLVAAVAYFALGAIWYSPVLFSKPWIKAHKIDVSNKEEVQKGMALIMIGSFILMLLSTIGLGIVYQLIPAVGLTGAVKTGLFVGLTFSTPAVAIGYLYNKKPLAAYLIDCGYHVVGLILASIVLVLWQ